jgi:hypothetical protein
MLKYTRLPKYFCRYHKVAVVWYIKGMTEEEIHVEKRSYGKQPQTDDQRVLDFVELWIEPSLLHPSYRA